MAANIRRVVASVAAWVVGTAAAVGVGLLALSVVGGGLTGQTPQSLTPESVAEQASSAAPTDTPAPVPSNEDAGREMEPSETPFSPARDQEDGKLFTSPGGTAIATCGSRGAYLVSWSPAQGYQVHEVERGPDSTAKVEFQSPARKVLLTVRCVGGNPQAEFRQETR